MIAIENLATTYGAIIPHRDRRLFTVFLLKGYHQTTLNSVQSDLLGAVVYAKVCLGMFITLYDDLADNPALLNPELLKKLYRLNFEQSLPYPELTAKDAAIYDLALLLLNEIESTIKTFPNYQQLKQILAFDLSQFYLANQYSELVTIHPEMRNLKETTVHGAYNMGIVAAGIIDLMASPGFNFKELGLLRESFILGQRIGRIGNIIHTFQREQNEKDLTSEMLLATEGVEFYKKTLIQELETGLMDLRKKSDSLSSISLNSYIEGLRQLYTLHLNMEGII